MSSLRLRMPLTWWRPARSGLSRKSSGSCGRSWPGNGKGNVLVAKGSGNTRQRRCLSRAGLAKVPFSLLANICSTNKFDRRTSSNLFEVVQFVRQPIDQPAVCYCAGLLDGHHSLLRGAAGHTVPLTCCRCWRHCLIYHATKETTCRWMEQGLGHLFECSRPAAAAGSSRAPHPVGERRPVCFTRREHKGKGGAKRSVSSG